MAQAFELNMIDYSSESTRTKWYMADVDAVSFVAVTAAAQTIRTALEAISLCNEKSMTAPLVVHSANGVAPSDQHAQRELAVKVFYVDNVNGRKGELSIPGPDLQTLTLAKDEVALADSGVMAALVTALQNNARSRDGNAITVTSARLVGRNN